MKWVARGLMIVLVLAIAAAIGAYFYLDVIARAVIEHGTAAATGVPTQVQSAQVQAFAGKLAVRDLVIDNPSGFQGKPFLQLGRGDVAVTLGSLLSQKVNVTKLRLDHVSLHLIRQGGKTNYQVILNHLKKLDSGKKEQSNGKTIVIHDLRNDHVTVKLSGFLGGPRTLTLPPIHLQNVGTAKGAHGVRMDQLTGVVIGSIFQSLVRNVGDLPGILLQSLHDPLKQLGNLGQTGAELLQGATQVFTNTANKTVAQGAQKLGQGLGALLGSPKTQKQSQTQPTKSSKSKH